MKDTQQLACFVHGVLFAFHTLGALYNFKRGNKWQAGLHVSVATYDLWAVNKHYKAGRL